MNYPVLTVFVIKKNVGLNGVRKTTIEHAKFITGIPAVPSLG